MRQRALPRLLVSLSLLALCAGVTHAQDWPTYLGTPGRVSASTGDPLDGGAPFWEVDTLATNQPAPYVPRIDFAPAVSGNVVVVGGADMAQGTGLLTAYEADTGAPLWEVPLNGLVHYSPTIAGGDIIIGVTGTSPAVEARDLADGSLLWRYSVAATYAVVTSPIVAGDKVVFAAGFGNSDFMLLYDRLLVVLPLNPAETDLAPDDALVRTLIANDGNDAPVAMAGSHVFAGGFDRQSLRGYVRAFDVATGELVWDAADTGDNGYFSAPVVADDRVFVGNVDGSVDAFDAASGDLAWRMAGTGSSVNGAMAYADGRLYAWTGDSIFALDGVTGVTLWSMDWSDNASFTPTGIAVGGGVLYALIDTEYQLKKDATFVHVESGDLVAIDGAQGSVLWSHEIGRTIFSGLGPFPVALGDGFMIVTTEESRDGVTSYRLGSFGAAGDGDPAAELLECQSDLATCEAGAGTCASDLASCQTTSGTCQSDLATCGSARTSCETDLGQCEAAKADLAASLADSQAAETACHSDLTTCQDQRDDLSSDLTACETARGQCLADLSASDAAADQCAADLAASDAAADQCAADLATTQSDLATAQDDLAATQADFATCQGDLAACQSGSGGLEAAVTSELNALRDHFRTLFRDPNFELAGDTPAEQLATLVQAIESLPGREAMQLYRRLGGRPNAR